MIRAAANTVEYSTLKLCPQFLIDIFIEGDNFLFPIRMLNEQLDFFVRHKETEVNDIPHRRIIDTPDFISCHKTDFFRKTVLYRTKNDCWILFSHMILSDKRRE